MTDYRLIITIAFALAAVVGVICVIVRGGFCLKTLTTLAAALSAIMSAYLISSLIDVGLQPNLSFSQMRLFGMSVGKQYYVTVILFFATFSLITSALNYGSAKCCDMVCSSVILFSIVARLACMQTGCCGGKVISGFEFPSRELEMMFGMIFLCLSVRFNKGSARRYIFCYSVFRLIFDFFRLPNGQLTLWIFSVSQLLAVVVIVFYLVMGKSTVKNQNEVVNYEKQQNKS